MLNPSVDDLLKKIDCRYSLVIATSKRARQIIDEELETEGVSTTKPISAAVNEFYNDKFTVIKSEK